MEHTKGYLPDVIQMRVDDLADAQVMDEEMTAHMGELTGRIADLAALSHEDAVEQAGQLAEEIKSLCSRIRRGYVAIAYRQGLIDGAGFASVVAPKEQSTAE